VSAHDFIVRRWNLDGTSAEPDPFAEALVVCSETVFSDREDEIGSWSTLEVRKAALCIERATQERLWELGGPGGSVPVSLARRIANAQLQAHEGVTARSSRTAAKAIQAVAAAGREPLTICAGKRGFRFRNHDDVVRYNAPDLVGDHGHVPSLIFLGHGDGCGLIFVDSSKPRRPNRYCDRCRARDGKNPSANGKAKSALARLRDRRRA
jgi:hypothetical protein